MIKYNDKFVKGTMRHMKDEGLGFGTEFMTDEEVEQRFSKENLVYILKRRYKSAIIKYNAFSNERSYVYGLEQFQIHRPLRWYRWNPISI